MEQQKKEPFQRYFFPALLWLLAITVLSVMPGVQLPEFSLFEPDKLAHAFMYGQLVWLFHLGFYRKSGKKLLTWKRGLGIFMFAALWGMLMEIVQSAFPYRSFEWDDEIANAFGALVGLFLARWWFLRKA